MKTTYYLLKNGDTRFVAASGTGLEQAGVKSYSASREQATRFDSVRDVLTFIGQAQRNINIEGNKRGYIPAYLSDTFNIVRVEETPSKETRRVLGETESPREGESLWYAVRQDDFGNPYFVGQATKGFGKTLEEARLFDTQADAIYAITAKYKPETSIILHPTIVQRVAVGTEVVITETVLQ